MYVCVLFMCMCLHAVDDDRLVAGLVLPVQHSFEKFEHRSWVRRYFSVIRPTAKLQHLDITTL